MPSLASGALEPELMDDPGLDPVAHGRALRGLARINRWSGTAGALWRTLDRVTRPVPRLRILDLACGGGDVTIALARRAARSGRDAVVHGADVSARALERARTRAAQTGVAARFHCLDVVADPWPGEYDAIVSSLFLHHLDGDDLVALLRRAAAAAGRAIVMSDLRRTRTGLLLATAGTRVLSRSPVVHADGPQSVRAALTPEEMRAVAATAGLEGAHVRVAWPQRMILAWSRP